MLYVAQESFMDGAVTGASLPGSANQYISPYNNSESMSIKSNNLGLRPRGTCSV